MIAFKHLPPHSADEQPVFEPGQLVCHRRYDYRGVVVARDMACQASDDWYYKNQTQPSRNQPWYHVLVDQTETSTYAAAENLVADTSGLPVEHPLVPHFFSNFQDGAYRRNDIPWPGGS